MPKVHKNILIIIAGTLWSGIGILLNSFAIKWFKLLSQNELTFAISTGIILGILITYFGFSKLAQKNIDRISLYNDKVCIWAFQKWQSYILIIFMISLGIFMRKSGLVPKVILTPIYISIGFALFTASFKYYIYLFKLKQTNA